MEPLDQVCSIGAYAPNRTSKLQNKSENDDSILGRLTALSFKNTFRFQCL